MKFSLYLLILILVFASCKEEKKDLTDPRAATDTLQVKFSHQKKPEIVLSPTAREAISGWDSFTDLEQNLKRIDTSTLKQLRLQAKDYIDNALQAVTKSSDTFVNNAIKSRLLVVYSKLNTLVQEASKTTVDTAQVNKEGTELYNAFQNLKLQINLKHQKSIEELLEQYEIEADSLSAVNDSAEARQDSLLKANRVPVQNKIP